MDELFRDFFIGIIVIVGASLLPGCKSTPKIDDAIRADITRPSAAVARYADEINVESRAIRTSVNTTPIDRERIIVGTDRIERRTVDLSATSIELAEADTAIKAERERLLGTIERLEHEIAEANESVRQEERATYLRLIQGGVALIVAGALVIVFLKNPTLGGGIAGTGIVAVGVGKFLLGAGWIVAAVCGAGLIALLAFIGWMVWKNRARIEEEIVKRAEFYRDLLDDESREGVRELVAADRAANPKLDAAMRSMKD